MCDGISCAIELPRTAIVMRPNDGEAGEEPIGHTHVSKQNRLSSVNSGTIDLPASPPAIISCLISIAH
jgi:hypothetical protein